MAAVLSQQQGLLADSSSGSLCMSSSDVLRHSSHGESSHAVMSTSANGRGQQQQQCSVDVSQQQTDIKVDIVNILCNFKTHCHLDLRTICMTGANVVFRRDPKAVVMKLRSPAITANIWSSGKVVCMGARSESEALIGARRVARKLQKCGFKLRFVDFQVKNVFGTVSLPFGVRIDRLKDAYPREVSYEPELHPAASWRLPDIGGQLQVFQTGSLSVTAPNVDAAQKTFQTIYPKLLEFRKAKDSVDTLSVAARGKKSPVLDGKNKRQKTVKSASSGEVGLGLPAEFDEVDWDGVMIKEEMEY